MLGMCFAIEPIITAGTSDVDMSDLNGWIVRTKDGKPSVQWEVQLVVIEDGYLHHFSC